MLNFNRYILWVPLLTMCNKPRKDFIVFDTVRMEFQLVQDEFMVDMTCHPNHMYENPQLNDFDFVNNQYKQYLLMTGMHYQWDRMIKRVTQYFAPNPTTVKEEIGPSFIIKSTDVMDDDDVLVEGYREPENLAILQVAERKRKAKIEEEQAILNSNESAVEQYSSKRRNSSRGKTPDIKPPLHPNSKGKSDNAKTKSDNVKDNSKGDVKPNHKPRVKDTVKNNDIMSRSSSVASTSPEIASETLTASSIESIIISSMKAGLN